MRTDRRLEDWTRDMLIEEVERLRAFARGVRDADDVELLNVRARAREVLR